MRGGWAEAGERGGDRVGGGVHKICKGRRPPSETTLVGGRGRRRRGGGLSIHFGFFRGRHLLSPLHVFPYAVLIFGAQRDFDDNIHTLKFFNLKKMPHKKHGNAIQFLDVPYGFPPL